MTTPLTEERVRELMADACDEQTRRWPSPIEVVALCAEVLAGRSTPLLNPDVAKLIALHDKLLMDERLLAAKLEGVNLAINIMRSKT